MGYRIDKASFLIAIGHKKTLRALSLEGIFLHEIVSLQNGITSYHPCRRRPLEALEHRLLQARLLKQLQ